MPGSRASSSHRGQSAAARGSCARKRSHHRHEIRSQSRSAARYDPALGRAVAAWSWNQRQDQALRSSHGLALRRHDDCRGGHGARERRQCGDRRTARRHAFARAVVDLYNDRARWETLSANGLEFVRHDLFVRIGPRGHGANPEDAWPPIPRPASLPFGVSPNVPAPVQQRPASASEADAKADGKPAVVQYRDRVKAELELLQPRRQRSRASGNLPLLVAHLPASEDPSRGYPWRHRVVCRSDDCGVPLLCGDADVHQHWCRPLRLRDRHCSGSGRRRAQEFPARVPGHQQGHARAWRSSFPASRGLDQYLRFVESDIISWTPGSVNSCCRDGQSGLASLCGPRSAVPQGSDRYPGASASSSPPTSSAATDISAGRKRWSASSSCGRNCPIAAA